MRLTVLLATLGLEFLSVPLAAQGRKHEPAGFEPITRITFEQELAEGWTKRKHDHYQRLDDASAPCSPPGIGRANFNPGFQGGRGPIDVRTKLPPGYRSIYVSFCVRFSENWVGHPSGVNKIFHFWINKGNRVYLSAQGQGTGPLRAQVRLQGINEERPARNLAPQAGTGVLRRRAWQRWEVVLTANTPGQRDGRAQWWVDGTFAGSVANIRFIDPAGSHEWGVVSWNPTWGGTRHRIETLQFMDIDDIYISGSRGPS